MYGNHAHSALNARKPRSHIVAILLCLFFSIPFLAPRRDLFAQCDVHKALSEVEDQRCLSKEQRAKLVGWLDKLPEKERGEALKTTAACYQCLLQKKVAADKYGCFRDILEERLYTKLQPEQLCLRDRLARALINLGQVLHPKSSSATPSQLDMGVLDRALNDFLAAYSACRSVHQNAVLATSIRLAEDWCLDPNAPWPPAEFTKEFIETLVRIAAVNPDQGRHLGAVLGAVLRDARSLGLDAQTTRELDDAYRLLIEQDRESLAGTSHFYIVKHELTKMIPRPDWAEANQIHALLKVSEDLQKRLDTGAERLQDRANAWRPFEEYSDLLYDLAGQIQSSSSERKTRDELIRRACQILRRGIEVSAGTEAKELTRVQEKLLDRVRVYGVELGRTMRNHEVIDFEARFLDPSSKTLTESEQCYIHAHLAQAYYMLEDLRKAMEHLGMSCGLISFDDLKKLKEQTKQ